MSQMSLNSVPAGLVYDEFYEKIDVALVGYWRDDRYIELHAY
jgi:hypothetical protein